MEEQKSRKRSAGRPALDPLEKQRRLVTRLHVACSDHATRLQELAGITDSSDADRLEALNITLSERLDLARQVARLERSEHHDEAKEVRQKLNLFRDLGVTEEEWNAAPRKLKPGKPKMPTELELARLEIERDLEQKQLRVMENAEGQENVDISDLLESYEPSQAGHPSRGPLGALDRRMATYIYKKRDLLARYRDETIQYEIGARKGRPEKPLEERVAHLDSVINGAYVQIQRIEADLDLIELQHRLIKRMRDQATRLRLRIKDPKAASALVSNKLDLETTEKRIAEEIARLHDFVAKGQEIGDKQAAELRKSVAIKIKQFDAHELLHNQIQTENTEKLEA
jgi:hypothetical protein